MEFVQRSGLDIIGNPKLTGLEQIRNQGLSPRAAFVNEPVGCGAATGTRTSTSTSSSASTSAGASAGTSASASASLAIVS